MPAPEGNVSRMTSLSALPSSEGYGVGDIENVKGVLYVLADKSDNNQFHGTAGLDSNEEYLGAIKVDGESAIGSFVDPEVRGEVTWVHTDLQGKSAATNVPLVRLRILRSAFTGAPFDGTPPATLYVRIVDQSGQTTEVVLNERDQPRDTTGVYAWKSADTGPAIDAQPGDTFTASVYSDRTFTTPVNVHNAHVWQRWLPGQLPRASVVASTIDADTAEKQKAIRDAIDAESKLVAGPGVRIGASNDAGRRTIAAV